MEPRNRLAILDVGHGNCAVLKTSEGVVVIDAGPKSGLLEYLSEQKISTVDIVLISHADQDHIAGLIALIASQEIEINSVRLNTDSLKTSALWDDLLYVLSSSDIDFSPSLTTQNTGEFDRKDAHIEILYPTPYLAGKGAGSTDREGRKLSSNSMSALIRLSKQGKAIALFPGDIDEVGLKNIIEQSIDIAAPILVFPHHGGKPGNADMSAFSKQLCTLSHPQIAVFSIGRGRQKTPQPEIVAALREHCPNIRIICTQLSERCASTLPLKKTDHLLKIFSQGQEKNKCCAGSIVVYLDEPDAVLPLTQDHQTFISNHAPTALCK